MLIPDLVSYLLYRLFTTALGRILAFSTYSVMQENVQYFFFLDVLAVTARPQKNNLLLNTNLMQH